MERVSRYTLAVVAVDWLPVPLLDTVLQNALRRRLVRGEATRAGRILTDQAVHELADEPVLDAWRLLGWPVRKVLGKLLLPLFIARTTSQTLAVARQARAV